jgi:hypothetical protein
VTAVGDDPPMTDRHPPSPRPARRHALIALGAVTAGAGVALVLGVIGPLLAVHGRPEPLDEGRAVVAREVADLAAALDPGPWHTTSLLPQTECWNLRSVGARAFTVTHWVDVAHAVDDAALDRARRNLAAAGWTLDAPDGDTRLRATRDGYELTVTAGRQPDGTTRTEVRATTPCLTA